MTLAFHMSADVALEAYDLFNFYDATTEEQRIEVIKQMIQQGYQITVFSTNRTPDQIVADQAKHGKVLYVKADGVPTITGGEDGEERLQDKDYEFCPNCERPFWDCACDNDDASSS